MSNILVINASGQETRVALIEQGTISEYYLERKNEKGIVGNVYKGKVVRVLPGMQAAFVDIGLDKAAFLYVADIVADPSFPGFSEEIEIQAGATEGDPLDIDDVAEPVENGTATPPIGSATIEAASPTPTPESVSPVAPVPSGDISPPPPPAEAAQPLEPRVPNRRRRLYPPWGSRTSFRHPLRQTARPPRPPLPAMKPRIRLRGSSMRKRTKASRSSS